MNSKKSLLPIVLSVALAGGVISCSQNKTTDEYLNEAQVFLQQNKAAEAIISLKNVLKVDANNAEARFLLGKSYINQGNWVMAEKELSRAKRYNYDATLVYPLLAEAYSHLEDSAGIGLLLKDIVDNSLLEQSLRYFLAITHVSESDNIRALSEFDAVVGLNTDSAYGQLGQAWLYGLRKQFDEAAEIAKPFLNSELYSAIALDFSAKTYFSAKKMELAAKNFEAYLQMRSQDHSNRLMYAMALAEYYNFEEAEVQADIILELSPNNAIANRIKGQARFAEKDFKEAKKFAENAIKEPGTHVLASIVAGVSAYQLGQLEVAHTHFMAVKDTLSYQHPAQKLLMQIRFQLGYSDENFNELSNAPIAELDIQLLSESAQELFRIGKVDKAEKLIQKANKMEPENARIIYQQGVIRLLNEDDSAIEFFKLALEKNPELDAASLVLAMELVEEKKYKEAFNLANELKSRNPQLAFSLIGAIYKYQGNVSESKSAFQRVIALNDKHIGALYNLGVIAKLENDLDNAVNYFQQVLDNNPEHLLSIKEMLVLSLDKIVQEKVKQYFENERATTHSESSTIALTEYYLIHKDLNEAQSIVMNGLKLKPTSVKLLMLAAKVETYLQNFDSAMQYVNTVIAANPQNVVIHAYKASLFMLQGDLTKAIEEQKIATSNNPNATELKINLANLYLKNGDLVSAKKELLALKITSKDNIGVLEVEGRIEFLDKNYQQASKLLAVVYHKRPSELVLLELVTSLEKTERVPEAIDIINSLEKSSTQALPIKVVLKKAELYALSTPEKAIDLYIKLANKTNGHYMILNNLAWLYLSQGNDEQALVKASLAIKSAPDKVAVQDTYGVMLLNSGNKIAALEVLEKVYNTAPNNLNYKIHYAEALLANNDKIKAQYLIKDINKSELDNDALVRLSKMNKKLLYTKGL